ncbi:MAG: N-succinylarginine dihydrolase [Burkholderiales bacterium]|nr:N-succinylarginine dihydrolase [Burkholderiales bacterium]
MVREVNFDGIPGPTHNYAGLAQGNLAAERHAQRIANPREAALQGLAKMRSLAARGVPQAVLPPHERPSIHALRALGFAGSDARVIECAARDAPALLAACSSAAAMWAANAATVSPSIDTADRRVHFTPANLAAHFHRALEAPTTTAVLRAIFADERRFIVHDPLPGAPQLGDEGAANHTRLSVVADAPGIEFFVYGRRSYGGGPAPSKFPARQTHEASAAIARRHGLDPARAVFAQQHPAAIDAGVFHNDVIAVGHGRVLLCHERAYIDQHAVLAELASAVGSLFMPLIVRESEVTLDEAIATYLFNSQLVDGADGGLVLVAPAECREHPRVSAYLDSLVADGGPITEVTTFDLRQSMRNGGGPACLRLRVELTPDERAAVDANVLLDDALAAALDAWIRRHYRDRLAAEDLADPALLDESRRALDELSGLLRLGNIYAFQQSPSRTVRSQ